MRLGIAIVLYLCVFHTLTYRENITIKQNHRISQVGMDSQRSSPTPGTLQDCPKKKNQAMFMSSWSKCF